MADSLGYYEGKLRMMRKLQQELDERVVMIAEDCDEFWVHDIDPWSDNTRITYEDDGIYVSWSTWGCGEYEDHTEKIPYEYLDRDIWELNQEHAKREKQKLKDKLRRQRQEKKQQALEEIEHEKAELRRLKEKYPDEF